jgi:amino acid permease
MRESREQGTTLYEPSLMDIRGVLESMSIIQPVREPSVQTLNAFQAYFFAVNTVMCTGFLAIPWVFQSAGWLLGICLLAFFAFQSAWLSFMLLETMSRTEALAVLEDLGEPAEKTTLIKAANLFRTTPSYPQAAATYTRITEHASRLEISDRRMDCTSIVRLLFGETTSKVYLAGFSFVFFGVMTSYCSVFASSFASTVAIGNYETCSVYQSFDWDCRWKYSVYLAVFVLAEVILTLTSFEEQRVLQSVMACFRFLSILIIILTCLNAVHTSLGIAGKNLHDDYPNAVNLVFLAPAILISQFSFIYQPQLPSIAQSVQDRKSTLNKVVVMCSVTVFIVYCALGLLVPAAVNDLPVLCTIAYRDYSAGYPAAERPVWAALVSHIVVLFPAIDVVTTYPIIAISLSHNIFTLKYGSAKQVPYHFDKGVRLLCAALPGCFAFFYYDLSTILSMTSYLALALIPMMIPLMFNASRSLVEAASHYQAKSTGYKASTALTVFQMALIVFLFVYNLVV